MNRTNLMLAALALLAIVIGCEWEGSGDSDSWTGRVASWVNFNGVYRPLEGQSFLVSLHAPSQDGTPPAVEDASQAIGTADGAKTMFNGVLGNTPVVAGTVAVNADGTETFADNGAGSLVGSLGGTGTINYDTGAILVAFVFPPSPSSVIVSYKYARAGTPSSPAPGSSSEIYTMVVTHAGNRITMTDNYGTKYSGRFITVATAGGDNTGNTAGEVIATFEAVGADGLVKITGTFQGVYTPGDPLTGTAGTLEGRTMSGTWIEGSISGDLQGYAAAVSVPAPSPGGTNTTPTPTNVTPQPVVTNTP